ncbi:MAG: D-sedoheptulose 7-phosphate isomerase [Verrucomicrobiales bacterium]
MSHSDIIAATIADHATTVERFREHCSETIAEIAELVIQSLEAGGKICFFGNGGSAADSQHFAAEFVVRFTRNRKPLASIAFTTDTSILTAAGNDFGYESVFARQVEGLCQPNDLVIGISTSGTSKNVVAGLESAKSMGVKCVAFTGENAATCGDFADVSLCVPSPVTARVQECHLIAGHLICDLGEAAFSE